MNAAMDEARRQDGGDEHGIDLFDFLYAMWRSRILVVVLVMTPVLAAIGYSRYEAARWTQAVVEQVTQVTEVAPTEDAVPTVPVTPPAERWLRFRAEYALDNDKELGSTNPADLVRDAVERAFRQLGLSPRLLDAEAERDGRRPVFRVLDKQLTPPKRGFVIVEVPSGLGIDMGRLRRAMLDGAAEQTGAALAQASADVVTITETVELLRLSGAAAGETLARNLLLVKRLLAYSERVGPSFRFVAFSSFREMPEPQTIAEAVLPAADEIPVSSVAPVAEVVAMPQPSLGRRYVLAAMIGGIAACVTVMFRIAIDRHRRREKHLADLV